MEQTFDLPQAKFVARCYEKGYAGYDNEGIKLFVMFNRISEADYEKITGVKYEA